MSNAAAPTIDPDTLHRNLDALSRIAPDLSRQLSALHTTDAPPAKTARTRDGRISFLIDSPGGERSWFGRTSIPSVRAEALLDQFDAGPANVLFPGVGHGTAVRMLLERLPRHRAVFAWETDAAPMLLALRLHDLAAAIADRRFIPLICTEEHLPATLAACLEMNPGHLSPNRIFMWPWQTPMSLNACRVAIESAGVQVERNRQARMVELRTRLRPSAGRPHAALLSLHAFRHTASLGADFAAAAARLDWQWTDLTVNSPGDVHPLARLEKLVTNGRPGWALLVDTTRREVDDVLPSEVPAVVWLTVPSRQAPDIAHRIDAADRVAVSGPFARQRVIDAGISSDRVHVCPPCSLAAVVELENPPSPRTRPIDVLILADLPPTDPNHYGYRLHTHQRIWNTALASIRERIDTFTAAETESHLARAERSVGTVIDDGSLRRRMLEHLGCFAAEGLLLDSLVQMLIERNVRCEIRGDGWPAAMGASPWPTDVIPALCRAKTFLHAATIGQLSPWALTAAGVAAAVLLRRHPLENEPGGAASMLKDGTQCVVFDTRDGLLQQLRRLLDAPARLAEIAGEARRRVLSDHVPTARLRALGAAATSFSTI